VAASITADAEGPARAAVVALLGRYASALARASEFRTVVANQPLQVGEGRRAEKASVLN